MNRLWLIVGLIVLAAVAPYVVIHNQQAATQKLAYKLAVKDRASKVAGCNRGKLDRIDNANGWWVSFNSDRQIGHDPQQPLKTRRARFHSARANRARAIRERGRIVDCNVVYPPAPKP